VNPADLVLVDGHNLLWMAAMGTPASVSSRDGSRDLTGVFMFFALLRKAIRENFTSRPETLIVFDGELGSAGRKAVDPGYKANRPQETPLPVKNLPDVKRGLDAIGLPWIEIDEHEADDVIASAARGAANQRCYIFSRDRDFYQLLSGRVHVLNTGPRLTPSNCPPRRRASPRPRFPGRQRSSRHWTCGEPQLSGGATALLQTKRRRDVT
jgi:DNA polymerase-1